MNQASPSVGRERVGENKGDKMEYNVKHPIRMIRIMKGKTLDDLHLGTGIQISKLSRLERGIIRVKDEEKEALGKTLNVDPSELFIEG